MTVVFAHDHVFHTFGGRTYTSGSFPDSVLGRYTRVVDIIAELEEYGITVDVHDPWVDAAEAREHYGVELVAEPATGAYDGIILAVAHRQFRESGAERVRQFGKVDGHVLYDLKYVFPAHEVDLRL